MCHYSISKFNNDHKIDNRALSFIIITKRVPTCTARPGLVIANDLTQSIWYCTYHVCRVKMQVRVANEDVSHQHTHFLPSLTTWDVIVHTDSFCWHSYLQAKPVSLVATFDTEDDSVEILHTRIPSQRPNSCVRSEFSNRIGWQSVAIITPIN